MEKYVLSFKQAVIRSISSRLPNILAAEEKYRSLITEINDEAENQKKKMKETYSKYEQNILENDRLKIETITTSELFEAIKNEKQSLEAKISQLTDLIANRDQ